MHDTSLVVRSTVRELVAAFQEAEQVTRQAFAALVAAEQRLAIFGEPRIRITAGSRDDDFADVEKTIERMSRDAWYCIIERLELRQALSVARAKQLDEQLEKGALPPITEENVAATVEQWRVSLGTMLAEAVAEVFAWLRPPGSKFKTNSELEIGDRVILAYMVKQTGFGGFRVHYQDHARFIALENVFSWLDGKGQIAKIWRSALAQAIEAEKSGRGATEYFEFKAHKNGTLHLRILRPDLLKRFNQIAGGARLRPAAA